MGHPEWIPDPRFADPRARVENRDALMPMIRPIIETRTTANGPPPSKPATSSTAPSTPTTTYLKTRRSTPSQALHWIEDRALGRVPMATLPGQPKPATGDRLSQSPALGAHSREVLVELGRSEEEIGALIQEGAIAINPRT